MILIAVDDLLFSSRIRGAAKQAGAEVVFARTPSEILRQARSARPTLAIFDLDADRADPIGTIRTLKSDPQLADIRTIAFVSHVHTQRIAAAREAGADEVMARSAFVARLGDIVRR